MAYAHTHTGIIRLNALLNGINLIELANVWQSWHRVTGNGFLGERLKHWYFFFFFWLPIQSDFKALLRFDIKRSTTQTLMTQFGAGSNRSTTVAKVA